MPAQSPQNNACDCCSSIYNKIGIQVINSSGTFSLCGWTGFAPFSECESCQTYRTFKNIEILDQFYQGCPEESSSFTASYTGCECTYSESGEYDGVSFDENCYSENVTETTKVTTGCCCNASAWNGSGDCPMIPDIMTETLSNPWTAEDAFECAKQNYEEYPEYPELTSSTLVGPITETCTASQRDSVACVEFGQIVVAQIGWNPSSGIVATRGKWRIVFYPPSSCYLKIWLRKVTTFTSCNEEEEKILEEDMSPVEWEATEGFENLCLKNVDEDIENIENIIIENENGEEILPVIGEADLSCGGLVKTYLKIVKYSCIKGYEPVEIPFDVADEAPPPPDKSDYYGYYFGYPNNQGAVDSYKNDYRKAVFQRDCFPDAILDS